MPPLPTPLTRPNASPSGSGVSPCADRSLSPSHLLHLVLPSVVWFCKPEFLLSRAVLPGGSRSGS